MDRFGRERQRIFSEWLRTGCWLSRHPSIELKFNPYHDPRNGRFTFAPGGPRALHHVVVSDRGRRQAASAVEIARRATRDIHEASARSLAKPASSDTTYRSDEGRARFETTAFGGPSARPGGSNSRAFIVPMTLQQVFPGLRDASGGAIVAAADNILNITGPAREMTAEMTLRLSNVLINQIKTIDPNYRFESLGFPQTFQGQMNQLNDLRFDRAEAFMRVKGELRPLQVETLRFVQASADRAYDLGLKLLRAGKLRPRLSEQEALGNFIDQRVRVELRERYNMWRIASSGNGPVRVNRRENNSNDLTFRRPDARVGSVAFDVTLSLKTATTPQVRGFFETDFHPTHVIIIRPRQLGPGSTYAIQRPGKKQ